MTAAKHLPLTLRTVSRRIGPAGTRPALAPSQPLQPAATPRVGTDITLSPAELHKIFSIVERPQRETSVF